jgi:predicted kinase
MACARPCLGDAGPQLLTTAVSDLPPLVIVSGPPAAGKSRLAASLCSSMHLPVVAKDAIKEVLMDHLGGGEAVGTVAFAVQFTIARSMLDGSCGLILEGAFFHDQRELSSLVSRARAAIVHVEAPLDCLVERYTLRAGERHPGHRGLEALPDLRTRVLSGAYEPPDLGIPVLRVDSTIGYTPSELDIEAWLARECLAGPPQRS